VISIALWVKCAKKVAGSVLSHGGVGVGAIKYTLYGHDRDIFMTYNPP